jgi:inner membrane protein
LDADDTIDFQTIPQQQAMLEPYLTKASPVAEELRDLIQFTEGFYAMNEASERVMLNDLRFGLLTGWFDLSRDFIFSFQIRQEAGKMYIRQQEQSFSPEGADFRRLWKRTLGHK